MALRPLAHATVKGKRSICAHHAMPVHPTSAGAMIWMTTSKSVLAAMPDGRATRKRIGLPDDVYWPANWVKVKPVSWSMIMEVSAAADSHIYVSRHPTYSKTEDNRQSTCLLQSSTAVLPTRDPTPSASWTRAPEGGEGRRWGKENSATLGGFIPLFLSFFPSFFLSFNTDMRKTLLVVR